MLLPMLLPTFSCNHHPPLPLQLTQQSHGAGWCSANAFDWKPNKHEESETTVSPTESTALRSKTNTMAGWARASMGRESKPSEQENLRRVCSAKKGWAQNRYMDWHGHERTALLNNFNHPVSRSWITECWPTCKETSMKLLGKKKQNKAESKFQPTNKAKVKGFQLCINQSSCATSLSRGAWQHEYGLDSTEYLNAYALYFPMLKLSCITTAIFLFSNHTCSAFQSFRHCVAVASCRTPRTWKISMPSTWSCEEIVIQRSCEMMCCLAMFITGQRSTRTQSELTAQGILEAKNTSLKKKGHVRIKRWKNKNTRDPTVQPFETGRYIQYIQWAS